ncbi:MAG: hypothetical protein NC820_06105, partial [Candidatus Omnitrophica bacterium]|nr:hypothetical protein [Candidatus Omnitrophota bacterium]
RLEEEIRRTKEGCVVVIDFLEIGAIDYSCADEIFARLILNLQHRDYGDKFVIFKNLSPHHKENIHIVLEKKDLAVLIVEGNSWTVLGSLDNYLLQTLKTIMEEGKLSSSELSSRMNLALNTASMRLGNLSKLRLVRKKNSINSSGKRYFVYESIINN